MNQISSAARALGYLGLVPMLLCLATAMGDGEFRWTALAVGYGYAAFIFSFLGGIWWGIGVAIEGSPRWAFAVAVAPSLLALFSYLPWIWGRSWPQPSLLFLGVCLMLSPLVDRAIALQAEAPTLPNGWMQLRWHLSLGLGAMTLALGLI